MFAAYDAPVFEHAIELPGGDVRTIQSMHPHAPPLVITVDGKRYVAAPVMTTVQAQRPWRYVPL